MESHGERVVETWQLPWSPMDSSVLDARLVQCLDTWLRMQWVCTVSLSDTTVGNGCSGRHRSFQFLDSWYWNALDTRSSEVSVLISS